MKSKKDNPRGRPSKKTGFEPIKRCCKRADCMICRHTTQDKWFESLAIDPNPTELSLAILVLYEKVKELEATSSS